jgi:hypothetical protein
MYTEAQLESFLKKLKQDPNGVDLTLYKDPHFFKALQLYAIKKIKIILFRINTLELQATHTKSTLFMKDVINMKEPDEIHGFSMLDFCLLSGLNEMATKLRVLGGSTTIDVALFNSQLEKSLSNKDHIQNILDICNELLHSRTKSQRTSSRTVFKELKAILKKHATAKNLLSAALLLAGLACIAAAPFTEGISGVLGAAMVATAGQAITKAGKAFLEELKEYLTSSKSTTIDSMELHQEIIDDLKQTIITALNKTTTESQENIVEVPEWHPEYELNTIRFSSSQNDAEYINHDTLKKRFSKFKTD